MTDLTTEYLDKKVEELKKHAEDQTETLAAVIAGTVAEPIKRHFQELKDYKRVKEDVESLKIDIGKIKQALNLS